MMLTQRCATRDGPPIQRDTDGDLHWHRLVDTPADLFCSEACLEIAWTLGVPAAHYLETGFFAEEPRYTLD